MRFGVDSTRLLLVGALGLVVACAVGAQAQQASFAGPELSVLPGGTAVVDGKWVTTWARVAPDGTPVEAGATIAFSILSDPPDDPVAGVPSAIAKVEFPPAVQATSFLNHLEIYWEGPGLSSDPYFVPHIDMHFYGIPQSQVARLRQSDTVTAAEWRMREGSFYGGPEALVPPMDELTASPVDLQRPFTAATVIGFYGGEMVFVEPMVAQSVLEQKKDFSLPIPPLGLGRPTFYPTRVDGRYDAATDSYEITFSGFHRTES